MNDPLEPFEPTDAVDLYLQEKQTEVSQATLYSHSSRLGHCVRWCVEEKNIENLNSLAGRDLQRYKLWRRDDGDLAPASYIVRFTPSATK